MDTLAHGLWSNVLVYNKHKTEPKQRFIAVLFGTLPDLLAFAPLFVYLFVSGNFGSPVGMESNHWTFRYAPFTYNYTHSFVIFSVSYIAVYFIRGRRHYFPMWAWALHIAMDLFTHPNFYQTPFLFPISAYRVPFGISWGHPVILALTYIPLFFWYPYWYLVLRKKYASG